MSSHDFFSQADSQTLTNLKHIIKMNKEISNSLSTAINRELIRKAAYNGFGVTANSVVSPALSFWHKAGIDKELPTGINLAKSILEEAGYVVEDGKLHYPAGQTELFGE